MLDSSKAIELFHGFRTNTGRFAPEANGALDSIQARADTALAKLELLTTLPEPSSGEGGEGGAGPEPTAKALEAVALLLQVPAVVTGGKTAAVTMAGEVQLRLKHVFTDIKTMGIAGNLLEKASVTQSACPSIQEAMSPLTDLSITQPMGDVLRDLDFDVAMPDFEVALEQAKLGIDTAEVRAAIDAGLAKVAAAKAALEPLNQQLNDAIASARTHYQQLKAAVEHAVNAEVLMSLWQDPCLRMIADAALPSELKHLMD